MTTFRMYQRGEGRFLKDLWRVSAVPGGTSSALMDSTQDCVLGYFQNFQTSLRDWVICARRTLRKRSLGLRPSFSSHVRFGERGAPVDFLTIFDIREFGVVRCGR